MSSSTVIRNDKNYSITSPGRIPSPDHEGGDFSPRTAQNIALGWEDVRDLKSGTITREVMDDTLPGGPRKKIITYEAPFDKCDREKDYAEVWGNLEKKGYPEDIHHSNHIPSPDHEGGVLPS